MKQDFNIYYGTIGKKLGVKYRCTRTFKSEIEAKNYAKNLVTSFYYKNEGKCGLPSFNKISEESRLTGISLEELYKDHIDDMCRWFVIPTDVDTVPKRELIYV